MQFASKFKIDDTMEDINDIFKQMNRDLAETVSQEGDASSVNPALDPRVVTQKESILYIKNPKADWAFNNVLRFQGDQVAALTLSLQSQQAIALLLNNSAKVSDNQAILQERQFKVDLHWGHTQTATGKLLDP